MIEAIGIILLIIGPISGFWGILWAMWDHRATEPGILIGGGLGAVIAGSLMT